MFENLTQKLTAALRMISSKGRLSESDVDAALREVRLALLEADVNFRIARDVVQRIREKAIGENVLEGISPGQQVIKIVNDELVHLLGNENQGLSTGGIPPKVILIVGLQGSGKTTTSAKLALHIRKKNQKVLLVAADLRRPAAMDQLETLGKQLDIPVFRENSNPDKTLKVAEHALTHAKKIGAEWAIIDTGGRLHADDELMNELRDLKKTTDASETLLVVDAMAGQDAVNAAEGFHQILGLTGIILSKLDGDARGGAALTVTSATGVPIKFAGVGEKMDALEAFHPERIASRILGMGDVLTLVEKVSAQITEEQAKELERKVRKATFDLEDFQGQLKQLQKMGSIGSIMDMIPGLKSMGSKLPVNGVSDESIRKIDAILSSMTNWEKHHPDLINGSRRKRIADGSGHTPADINRLLNQFKQMQKLMRQLSSGKKKGLSGLGIPGF
ncbi:MAG: signal recognition particle protein [Dehalococcoidia bacterium]|nr:signal recognition particle protein [Dehalococcoidia bacterium]|tara:strand:- start:8544 stop:9884 length:1341 start_codon:yes stop_codon:yes gene_type:complete